MSFDKTKLWIREPSRSEVASLTKPPDDGARAQAAAAQRAEARRAELKCKASQSSRGITRIFQAADLLPRASAPPTKGDATTSRAPSGGQQHALGTTRILPIESLLSQPAQVLGQALGGGDPSELTYTLPPAAGVAQLVQLWRDKRNVRLGVGFLVLAAAALFANLPSAPDGPGKGLARAVAGHESSTPTSPAPAASERAAALPAAAAAARISVTEEVHAAPSTASRRVLILPSASAAEPERGSRRHRSHKQRAATHALTPATNRDHDERRAADALAEGDYARAVQAYDVLAMHQPGRAVYHEAARILRARLARSPL